MPVLETLFDVDIEWQICCSISFCRFLALFTHFVSALLNCDTFLLKRIFLFRCVCVRFFLLSMDTVCFSIVVFLLFFVAWSLHFTTLFCNIPTTVYFLLQCISLKKDRCLMFVFSCAYVLFCFVFVTFRVPTVFVGT